MSGTLTRMHRPEAVAIARRFVELLDGTYDRLVVAGSLRRKLAFIGDIEVCVVPKVETVSTTRPDLFGGLTRDESIDMLDLRMTMLLDKGRVLKRPRSDGQTYWGPRAKYLTFDGARVDLFCAVNDWDKEPPKAEPERFGWILMLRTGPAEFSRQLVVPKGKVPGQPKTITRTKDGRWGLLPPHLVPKDGWLTYRTSGERIETPDEQSVFDLFGMPYQEPWERA